MPGIELHADYDRDGRVTGTAAERTARNQWPGAIVVANLDRDQRTLPGTPGNATLPIADFEAATALANDDELVPLLIRVAPGALAPGDSLLIHCSGVMHTRVRITDISGASVPHRLGSPEIFELPSVPGSGELLLKLQVRTIAGASFGRTSSLKLQYQHDAREETRFELTLLRRDSSGNEHPEDHGRFSVAPFILADRLAPAYRIYMVNYGRNWPAFSDTWDAAGIARVPMIPVDWRLTGEDTWVQDQYQHALMQGVNGYRELIVHLPRLRHDNAINTVTDNLEEFVNSHFRSRDIGLYRDLWERILPVQTAAGGVVRIGFRELEPWYKQARRLLQVIAELNRLGAFVDSRWVNFNPRDWIEALFGLEDLQRRLAESIHEARHAAGVERDAQLSAAQTAAGALVRAVQNAFRVGGSGNARTVISALGGQADVALTADMARRLWERARQMHDSVNYGGNIESTPPVDGAALGKIIIGNASNRDTGGEFMDPDLLRVLAKQQKQPIVEVDTSWLKVAHVDEMISVVPHARSRGGFSILHASAQAALEILQRAVQRHRSGLPVDHPMSGPELRPPSGVLPRLMTDGTRPVTRLFRGKHWRHRHRQPEAGEVAREDFPPSIYMRLCAAFGSDGGTSGFNVHRIGLVPGPGPDRYYRADITPTELLWCEQDGAGNSCNAAFDSDQLQASRNILCDALPGIALLPVPVLYDRVQDVNLFRNFYWREPTTAYTSNMANLQVLNGHILVPKPYGPRMRPDDAIAVVRDAMQALNVPGSIRARVGRRLIAARRMTRAQYWVEKQSPAYLMSSIGTIRVSYGGLETVDNVKAMFRDSFPGASDSELERQLIRPNRRHFDGHGYLRNDYSLFRFDDGMVDLFELFVAAIAAELGVRLHFVDSWFYHLGEGEIHCGTNVLRKPRGRVAGVPDVWDAPDHGFRSQRFDFEPDVIDATGT